VKILLSGFKPFANDFLNSSEELVNEVVKKNHQLDSVILPVEFHKSFLVLKEHILNCQPNLLLMFGQATGRAKIGLEMLAVNWQQASIADEAGYRPLSVLAQSAGPMILKTQIPLEKFVFEFVNEPIEISYSAGSFVCNDLYYRVLREFPDLPSLFIHLPPLPLQKKEVSLASLELTVQAQTIRQIIQMSVDFLTH